MKKIIFVIILFVPDLFLGSCILSSSGKKTAGTKPDSTFVTQGNNIAVLELFTSQGCSSCPSADRLLGTYASREHIIPLSFHVDYWDRQGWKDPYSSHDYSRRQYSYDAALKAEVYTPQLIINGQSEMVGSDASKIASTIKSALAQPPVATLTMNKVTESPGRLNIDYTVSGKIDSTKLNIAVVDRKTTTTVNAGENGGATLTGYNVVRDFLTVNKVLDGDNTTSIPIQAENYDPGMKVILYLQEKGNHKIIAASQAGLP